MNWRKRQRSLQLWAGNFTKRMRSSTQVFSTRMIMNTLALDLLSSLITEWDQAQRWSVSKELKIISILKFKKEWSLNSSKEMPGWLSTIKNHNGKQVILIRQRSTVETYILFQEDIKNFNRTSTWSLPRSSYKIKEKILITQPKLIQVSELLLFKLSLRKGQTVITPRIKQKLKISQLMSRWALWKFMKMRLRKWLVHSRQKVITIKQSLCWTLNKYM